MISIFRTMISVEILVNIIERKIKKNEIAIKNKGVSISESIEGESNFIMLAG